jgi:hypothetical protein
MREELVTDVITPPTSGKRRPKDPATTILLRDGGEGWTIAAVATYAQMCEPSFRAWRRSWLFRCGQGFGLRHDHRQRRPEVAATPTKAALIYPSMTAAAFDAALAGLGMSRYQAAVFLGRKTRLIRDWASGRKPIPQPIAARLTWRLVSVRGPVFKIDVRAGAGQCIFPLLYALPFAALDRHIQAFPLSLVPNCDCTMTVVSVGPVHYSFAPAGRLSSVQH